MSLYITAAISDLWLRPKLGSQRFLWWVVYLQLNLLLDLQAYQVLKECFSQKYLTQFWAQLKDKLILRRESENSLLPFLTTYLCDAGFSAWIVIKTKYRNRLDAQHDILSMNIESNIDELVESVQNQESH